MSSMTATPDPATGSVLLEIVQTAPVLRVLRTNENGIFEVRALAGQFPSTGAGRLILTDYEAGHGLNTYTLVDGGKGAAAAARLDLDLPWLMVPVMPHYARQVETITGYGAGRESLGQVQTVPDSAAPLVALAPLALRTGSMDLWAPSLAVARSLESVFDRGEIAMLKQRVAGMDMYFTTTRTNISPHDVEGDGTAGAWNLAVDYVEVGRPAGPLAGALGWTFDALAAAFPTFDAVTAAYASFDDLTVNRRQAG